MLVVLAETAGAVIAFLIGRQLFGTRCARWLETCPYLAFLNQVSRRRGWKVVLLTRMVPFFPFKLSNYLFGLAGYPLREFAVGSLLGVIPLTVANVYLGSLAAGLATLGARPEQRAMWEWAVYGGGLLISLGIAAHLIRTARRTLGQLTAGHGKAAGERLRPHRE